VLKNYAQIFSTVIGFNCAAAQLWWAAPRYCFCDQFAPASGHLLLSFIVLFFFTLIGRGEDIVLQFFFAS